MKRNRQFANQPIKRRLCNDGSKMAVMHVKKSGKIKFVWEIAGIQFSDMLDISKPWQMRADQITICIPSNNLINVSKMSFECNTFRISRKIAGYVIHREITNKHVIRNLKIIN